MSWLLQLLGWVLGHPWTSAGALVGAMIGFAALILLNPNGRTLRELLRRRK